MLPIIPLLVLVAGILVYALASNAKVVEIGRAMLWTALLVCLLSLAAWHSIAIGVSTH